MQTNNKHRRGFGGKAPSDLDSARRTSTKMEFDGCGVEKRMKFYVSVQIHNCNIVLYLHSLATECGQDSGSFYR